MSFRTWFAALQVARTFDRLQREWRRSPRRRRASYSCAPAEVLEVRSLLSSYTAASVSALVADINAANANGGTNTITLAASTKFDLTARDNITNGLNGLPVISGKNGADNLTIIGNGATIDRSSTAGVIFRLFDVANGNSLTLENLTLQNGLGFGGGAAADGGAVFNQGSLTLNGVTVQKNVARGNLLGTDAAGGGIYSSGVLTLEGGTTVQNNVAVGTTKSGSPPQNGGNGFGGGLYVAGGTAVLTNATLSYNRALGSNGGYNGNGGNGFGGGMEVAGGTVSVRNSTLSFNTAQGANGATSFGANPTGLGNGGSGFGGALQVSGGTVSLISDTLSSNAARGGAGSSLPGNGGNAFGGALQVNGGTVSVGNSTLSSNTAQGGNAGFVQNGFWQMGNGGNGFGGALEVNSGTLSLTSDTVSSNSAQRSIVVGQVAGVGAGGGLYIASGATVDIDAFTLAHFMNNTASTSDPEIHGTYIKI
jgi:hypothetical protein